MLKTYYTILLFICLGFKPFYTIGYISYYELNIDDIVQKYCVNKLKPKFKCNGKCHLAKRLSFTSVSETENDQKEISNSLSEAFFPVFFQKSKVDKKSEDLENSKNKNFFITKKNYNVSLSITSPPPRC